MPTTLYKSNNGSGANFPAVRHVPQGISNHKYHRICNPACQNLMMGVDLQARGPRNISPREARVTTRALLSQKPFIFLIPGTSKLHLLKENIAGTQIFS